MTVSCQACGELFATFQCHIDSGGKKGTHCPNCRSRKKQVAVVCAQCGAPFTVKESEHRNNKTGNFYCSQKCMGLWRTAHLVGEAHHNFKAKIEVACEICGAKKLVHESQFKTYRFFLCSNECRGIWRHQQTGVRDTRVTVACASCGTGLKRYPTGPYEKAFCNQKCVGKWKSEHNVGASNPNYSGGFQSLCFQCGKAVWVKPSHANEPRHHCSKECAAKTQSALLSGDKSPAWKGGTVKRQCVVCGTLFEIKQADAKRAPGKYCSRQCAGKAHQSVEFTECPWCKQPFNITPSMVGRAKFCSRKCQHASRRVPKPMRKLHRRIHQLVYAALKKNKAGYAWEELVGYSIDALRSHLESLFWPGMSWENMGEWHIDHLRPRNSFRFSRPTDPQFLECWSLSNLQPLWKLDNLRKSSRRGFVRGQIVSHAVPQSALQ